jgi:FkbM family methyltransferase
MFPRRPIVATLAGGIRLYFDLRDFIGKYNYYFFDLVESNMVRVLQRQLPVGGVFLDIGANIGIYSLIAANIVGEQGKVYSFEPSPREFGRLIENVKLNSVHNIECINVAVGANSGTSTLFVNPLITSTNYVVPPPDILSGSGENTVEVQRLSIDEFVEEKQIDRVHCIKIDVEGYENYVLEGMAGTVARDRPICIVELCSGHLKRYSADGRHLRTFFDQRNYVAYLISKKNMVEWPATIDLSSNGYYNVAFIPR